MIRTEKNRNSKAYIATIDPTDETDQSWLKQLRKQVSQMNKFRKEHELDTFWSRGGNGLMRKATRVTLKPRIGKNNPNREKYRTRSGWLNYQTVYLEDAQRIDVYVHEYITSFRSNCYEQK